MATTLLWATTHSAILVTDQSFESLAAPVASNSSRLYSIPETCPSKCLATPQGAFYEPRKEANMNTLLLKLVKWCNVRSFTLVLILSVCHIGLAYMHTR